MRAFITWTTVLLVLLLSGNVFAAVSEDASWERDADAAVWDHAVDAGTMPRTSFSSAGATRRTADMRQEARRILEHRETEGTTDTAVVAAILKECAGRGVLPLTAQESSLITGASIHSSLHHYRVPSLGGRNRDRYGHSMLCSAVIAGNGTHRTGAAKNANRIHHNKNNDTSRVNLAQYATDCSKADYYGLFLYLWEDGPWDTRNADIFIRTVLPGISTGKVCLYNPTQLSTPSHIPLTFPCITKTTTGVLS